MDPQIQPDASPTQTPAVSSKELLNLISRLNDLLDKNEDHDARKMFGEIFVHHDYEMEGGRKVGTVECGSIGTPTAQALYRLLFLTKPKRVDFSEMYKSCSLFALRSPDGTMVGDVQFYKYELAVYFSATKEHIEGRQPAFVCGVPGHDNGIRAKSDELKAWIALLKRCLDRKWMVYGGNNFEV